MARFKHFITLTADNSFDLMETVEDFCMVSKWVYGGGYTRLQNIREAFRIVRFWTDQGKDIHVAIGHLLDASNKLRDRIGEEHV